jgi:aminoglycoside 3-N-acetyltransferase
MNSEYTKLDINKSLKKIGIKKKDILYVSANLINFGLSKKIYYKKLPKTVFDEIYKIIGKEGTIMVPSHTFNLVNTNKIFNPYKTKSISGSFSNYIIENKKFYRQFHPYASISGVGKYAKYICEYKNNDVYGLGCPFEKLIELNAKFISLGMEVNKNCSQVHFLEKKFNVKYRFKKYFDHKILVNNKIIKKKFEMFVLKEKFRKIKRNENNKIFDNFYKKNKIKKHRLGQNWVYSYNLKNFYEITKKLFFKNKNVWLG